MLLRFSLLVLVTGIPAILLAIPWGILGVATTLALCFVAITAVWTYRVAKHVQVTLADYCRALWGVVEATTIMTAGVVTARAVLLRANFDAALTLTACILLGVAIYIPALRWRAPGAFDMIRDLALRALGRRAR